MDPSSVSTYFRGIFITVDSHTCKLSFKKDDDHVFSLSIWFNDFNKYFMKKIIVPI